MGRILKLVTGTTVAMAFMGGSVAAQTASGTISDTGRDSDNTVNITIKCTVTVVNNNYTTIVNDTDQTAESGDSQSSDNRGSGDTTTGNASNTSTTTTTVEIANNTAGCNSLLGTFLNPDGQGGKGAGVVVAAAPAAQAGGQGAAAQPAAAPVVAQAGGQGAGGQGAGAQVEAPVGAANAGSGSEAETSLAAAAGLVGSFAALGAGLSRFGRVSL